jgi:hypothetical protein
VQAHKATTQSLYRQAYMYMRTTTDNTKRCHSDVRWSKQGSPPLYMCVSMACLLAFNF